MKNPVHNIIATAEAHIKADADAAMQKLANVKASIEHELEKVEHIPKDAKAKLTALLDDAKNSLHNALDHVKTAKQAAAAFVNW